MYSIMSEKHKAIAEAVEFFIENENISITACAKRFNIHRETLANKLKELGLHEDRRRVYKCNENYFEVIDNQSKAYWLGFIVADGCVTKDGRLKIKLSLKDEKQLIAFHEEIENKRLLYYEKTKTFNKEYDSVISYTQSMKVLEDLKKHNIFFRKSMIALPANLNEDLIPHYIRGIYDGDGWLSWNKNSCEIGIGMNYEMLEYIKFACEKYAGIKSYDIKKYRKICRYRVTSKDEVIKFLNYIYKDSIIYLERKYEKYLEFCRFIQK